MNDLIPLADIDMMATVAATSRMFGFKNKDEAMAIMLLCQAEGLHPAIAMRDYHVIQGRPTLKADAMLARFQQAGGKVKWLKLSDQEVSGTFTHAAGGSATITWTFEAAKKIGLTGKENWKNYPRAMLRARVVSEGIRTVYPGVVVGTYTPEEAQDMEQNRPMIDVTPAEPEPSPQPEPAPAPQPDKAAAPAAEHGISGEGLEPPKPEAPARKPAAPPTPAEIADARAVFESVKVMVGNAKDMQDIDDCMKANAPGLKRLLAVSEPNYNKLKAIVTDRRFALASGPTAGDGNFDPETGEIPA